MGFLSGRYGATHITSIKPSQPHRHVGTGTRNLRLTDAVSHFASIILKAKRKIPPSLLTASILSIAIDNYATDGEEDNDSDKQFLEVM